MIKILYLEDNKFDVELTQIEFRKAFPDSKLDVANTIEGVNKLLEIDAKYDVAILDLNLPDGNGIDILMKIRQQNFPIAVVILTGSGNEESAIAALKAGADDYLTKNQGYLKKLPDIILNVLENFRKNIEKRSKPLNVLYVEWNTPDIEFTKRHMQKYAPHIHIQSVTLATELLNLIPKTPDEKCDYDILMMDYRLPGLNALDTVKIIRQERKLSIPIILVTGHGNEDVAVQALKIGADDYLVKRENYLFRLPSLITSAFQRHELELKQAALRESEAKYRLLAENSGDVIFIFDLNLQYVYVSPAVKALRGFEVEEALKQNLTEVLTPDSYKLAQKVIADYVPEKGKKLLTELPPQVVELEMIRKDGTTVWTEVKVSLFTDENNIPVGIQGVTRDISKRKTAQKELLKSREEYRSFFEDDLTGDFISHVDGYIINCNPAYLHILGFNTLEEAQKYDLHKIHINKKQREEMLEGLRKHKKLIYYEHDLMRTDGKIIYAVANIIGGFDSNGNLETIKGYIIDDTERKKAINELRKLSMAIEQSPASVIITDTKGSIEYVNPKFSEVTGYSFNEVIDQNPRILKSGNLTEVEYSELWEKITNGETWKGEFQNRKKDGTLFWESASISPIKMETGVITHFLAVKEDITDKKKYEEELIVARDQAQESNRLKSAFLATMSHELRTPLNAIIGFSGLIDESLPKPEIINFNKIIHKSGNHLLNIIEDIFTVSLLQAGHSKTVLEKFELNEFFNSLTQFANFEIISKNKQKLKIVAESDANNNERIIKTDKTKLFQVLINFIKNAIEYSETGEIEIGYFIAKNDIEFYVKDSGIGIHPDQIEIIFEQFRQIDDSHTRSHGGVGLGLAICSEIAKLLKGKIRAESILGKGSTFFFTLNSVIVENHELAPEKPKSNSLDLKNRTILIAEDEELNYMLLQTYLRNTQATLIWAKNGEESIALCENNPQIDLVLMDIRMPGIDGIEATKQIKKLRPELKIIAQTAYALVEDRAKILSSGCEAYISKPIKSAELIKVIKEQLDIKV